ncbi:MAG: hypothetical protein KBS94_02945 [Prevotella sp.]|nr:hypothetical protein [Candidatus Equicola faecalis]
MKKNTQPVYGYRPVYFCPQCGSINTFTNEQNSVVCYECGYMGFMDPNDTRFLSHFQVYEL